MHIIDVRCRVKRLHLLLTVMMPDIGSAISIRRDYTRHAAPEPVLSAIRLTAHIASGAQSDCAGLGKSMIREDSRRVEVRAYLRSMSERLIDVKCERRTVLRVSSRRWVPEYEMVHFCTQGDRADQLFDVVRRTDVVAGRHGIRRRW